MLTEAKNNLKFLFLSVKYNVLREMLNKASFLMNVLLMALNNISLIIQWVVLFSLKDDFNGYSFQDQMLTISLSALTFGLTFLFFGGVDNISKFIEQGALDKYLTKPKSVLVSVLTSRTQISALGDILFGIVLFLIYFHKPQEILLYILVSFLSFVIMLSFMIIINSVTFWFIRFADTVEMLGSAYLSFSMYPRTIFDSTVKVLMHTIIPIGFSIYIPVMLFQKFSIVKLLILIIFSCLFFLFARFLFYRGLKRYTSSNIAVINV